jgi:UDP-N-acetylmuramoyl-tripeptide--D-alanyl-D-alanine ligase
MLKIVNKSDKLRLEKIGYDESYDVHAENIELTSDYTSFDAVTKDNKKYRFTLNMIGEHNVLNALIGIQIAKDFGLTFEEMEEGLKNFNSTSMRLEFIKKDNFTIINDSYNANPDSMKAALEVISTIKASRKVAVLGTMKELGLESYKFHKEVAQYAKEKGIDLLVTVGEFNEAYKEGFNNNEEFKEFDNVDDACEFLLKNIKDNDCILVKASRSMKFETIVNKLKAKNC